MGKLTSPSPSHGIRVATVWPLFSDTEMLDGVATTSTSRLGIRLTADDVAKAVVDCIDAAYRDGERHTPKPAKTPYPVGLQARCSSPGRSSPRHSSPASSTAS